MSDETPIAVPAEIAPPAPRRCMGCGALVPIDEVIKRERNGKPFPSHRRRAQKGAALDFVLCGPIVETLIFHVYAKVQQQGQPERTIRTFLKGAAGPDDRLSILDEWERHLESEWAAKHEGAAVTVVVERWSLMGAKE
jgi:hypothetical protein